MVKFFIPDDVLEKIFSTRLIIKRQINDEERWCKRIQVSLHQHIREGERALKISFRAVSISVELLRIKVSSV